MSRVAGHFQKSKIGEAAREAKLALNLAVRAAFHSNEAAKGYAKQCSNAQANAVAS